MQTREDEIIDATTEIVERVLLHRALLDAQGIKSKDSHNDLVGKISSNNEEALIIVNSVAVKSKICAGIKSATNNVKEIAKIVLASLLPLSLAGTIAVPLTPMLLAAVILTVLDSGIAAYCDGIKEE